MVKRWIDRGSMQEPIRESCPVYSRLLYLPGKISKLEKIVTPISLSKDAVILEVDE